MQLKDKVAIVTGGARGIGAAIAHCLVAEGAKVAIVDLDGPAAEATAKALNGAAMGLGADVSQEKEIGGAAEQIVAKFGGIDFLINNAGGGRPGVGLGAPFTRVSQAHWDELLAVNLRTAFASSKIAIPHLQKRGGGAIVNIASVAGLIPTPAMPAYGAAKAAMVSLTQTLALELAPQNIRVNAICPGLLWTKAWESLATMMKMGMPQLAQFEPRQIFEDRVKRSVPMGREQTPEDIGHLAAFLCSDVARNITGQAIAVDGGITLKIGG